MHEMTLCENILQILEEQARLQHYVRVKKVWLEIGALACVEPEALRFSFGMVMRHSLAEGAALEIIINPGQAWCMPCGQSVQIHSRDQACPECGGYQLQITAGEEMRIKELEVE